MTDPSECWPALPLEGWQDTYESLHRWAQIVGKTRLAMAPMQNHWWQAALYVTARGLGTSTIPYGERGFDIELDFLSHALVLRTTDGATRSLALEPRSVADFYDGYRRMLQSAEIEVPIWPVPVEMADRMPFTTDVIHTSYDAAAAQRCWRILARTDRVLQEFRGGFVGKSSPSHFWWGAFDIACTRFSGRRAPRHPGGVPNVSDRVMREGYSHECISAGWWPGTPGGPIAEPAFYAYAYPAPEGCAEAQVRPAGAYFHDDLREWILPYEALRASVAPDAALREFLDSTYEAAAELCGWNSLSLERWQP